MAYTDEQLVERLLALRSHIEVLDKEAAERVKPFAESRELIEQEMLRRLLERKATNPKHPGNSHTAFGTFYIEKMMSTKMVDKVMFLDHVFTNKLRGVPNCYDILTQAVSKDSVAAYIEASKGHPPPGIEVTYFNKIKVRKS